MARSATEGLQHPLACGRAERAGSITVVVPPWRVRAAQQDRRLHLAEADRRAESQPSNAVFAPQWPGGPGCRPAAARNRSPHQRQRLAHPLAIGQAAAASEIARRHEWGQRARQQAQHASRIVPRGRSYRQSSTDSGSCRHRGNTLHPHGLAANDPASTPPHRPQASRRAERSSAGSRPSIAVSPRHRPNSMGTVANRICHPVLTIRAGWRPPITEHPGSRDEASGAGKGIEPPGKGWILNLGCTSEPKGVAGNRPRPGTIRKASSSSGVRMQALSDG